VVLEASGSVTNGNQVRDLIKDSVNNVIFARGAPDVDLTMVWGVNNQDYDPERHHVLSASTCTGNAMVPVAYVLDKHYGIESGNITTIHPVLSDQKSTDVAYPGDFRLGRDPHTSIIPTATKVAQSVATVLPQLEGRLSAISYRIPTRIVSVIDSTMLLRRDVSEKEIKELLQSYEAGSLEGVLECDEKSRKVTIDYLKSPASAIVLMDEIRVVNKRMASLSIIHDNEWAYCCRVRDIINYLDERNE